VREGRLPLARDTVIKLLCTIEMDFSAGCASRLMESFVKICFLKFEIPENVVTKCIEKSKKPGA
jgi:hypothetical protein